MGVWGEGCVRRIKGGGRKGRREEVCLSMQHTHTLSITLISTLTSLTYSLTYSTLLLLALQLFGNMSNFMKKPNIIVHLDLTPEESIRY